MAYSAAIAFNTLKFANRLKAVGIKPEHAEAEAEALAEVFEVNLSRLTTKEDLQRLEESLRKDNELLRKDTAALEESLRKDMATMEGALRKDTAALEESLRK